MLSGCPAAGAHSITVGVLKAGIQMAILRCLSGAPTVQMQETGATASTLRSLYLRGGGRGGGGETVHTQHVSHKHATEYERNKRHESIPGAFHRLSLTCRE